MVVGVGEGRVSGPAGVSMGPTWVHSGWTDLMQKSAPRTRFLPLAGHRFPIQPPPPPRLQTTHTVSTHEGQLGPGPAPSQD